MPFRLEYEPLFDFARQLHKLSLTSEGAVFRANGQDVVLHGAAGAERARDGGVRLDFSLEAGEIRGFLLETAAHLRPSDVLGALDRGIRMAESRGRPGDVLRWASTRDAVSQQVMSKCWNPSRRAFTQHPGTKVLDASNLLMPLVGFVAPKDPLWLSTLDAMNEQLVTDSLVYRYSPSASPDGLRGSEGTFSLCSFFYVDALARAGRLAAGQLRRPRDQLGQDSFSRS